jgi:hypothetical protein
MLGRVRIYDFAANAGLTKATRGRRISLGPLLRPCYRSIPELSPPKALLSDAQNPRLFLVVLSPG